MAVLGVADVALVREQRVAAETAADHLDVDAHPVALAALAAARRAVEADEHGRGPERVGDQIGARAAVHVVGAQAPVERVVVGSAGELVVVGSADQRVIAGVAVEVVVAAVAVQGVVAVTGVEKVVAQAADQVVARAVPDDDVGAAEADEPVGRFVTDQPVRARAAERILDVEVVCCSPWRAVVRQAVERHDHAALAGGVVHQVAPAAAGDPVRARVVGERVVAGAAGDVLRTHVVSLAGCAVAGPAVERHGHRGRPGAVVRAVGAGAAEHAVRATAAVEHVVIRPTVQIVRGLAAEQHVVAAAAADRGRQEDGRLEAVVQVRARKRDRADAAGPAERRTGGIGRVDAAAVAGRQRRAPIVHPQQRPGRGDANVVRLARAGDHVQRAVRHRDRRRVGRARRESKCSCRDAKRHQGRAASPGRAEWVHPHDVLQLFREAPPWASMAIPTARWRRLFPALGAGRMGGDPARDDYAAAGTATEWPSSPQTCSRAPGARLK